MFDLSDFVPRILERKRKIGKKKMKEKVSIFIVIFNIIYSKIKSVIIIYKFKIPIFNF